jgi:hypothetical protein
MRFGLVEIDVMISHCVLVNLHVPDVFCETKLKGPRTQPIKQLLAKAVANAGNTSINRTSFSFKLSPVIKGPK